VLEPAAFFNIEISDPQGRKVHQVSNGEISVDFRVDPNAVNPNTNLPYQPGDKISWYSYVEPQSVWKFEGISQVIPAGKHLKSQAKLPHLTWFYAGYPAGFLWESMSYGFLAEDPTTRNKPIHYKVTLYFWEGDQLLFGSQNYFDGYPLPENYNSVPRDEERRFYFIGMRMVAYKLVFENDDRSCGDPAYSFWSTPGETPVHVPGNNIRFAIFPIPIKAATSGSQSEALIHIKIRCTDSRKVVYPTQKIYARYRELGSTCWIYRWVKSGETVIPGIKPGTIYEVQANYSKKWQPADPYRYIISSKYIPRTRIDVTFEIDLKCN
jgi:hypothetical protein